MKKNAVFKSFVIVLFMFVVFKPIKIVAADAYQDFLDDFFPNGELVIDSVKPVSASEASEYIRYNLENTKKILDSGYRYSFDDMQVAGNEANFDGKYEFRIYDCRESNNCYNDYETINVNVTFDDSKKDDIVLAKVSSYIENFEQGRQYLTIDNAPYEILIHIDDMELLSYLLKVSNGNDALRNTQYLFNMLRYNTTFREITKNMNFVHSSSPYGNGLYINGSYIMSCLGHHLLFEYDGFIYGRASSSIREFILNTIYIDENVGNDNNSIMAAVQKRLDDNFGKNVASVSLGDMSIFAESTFDDMMDEIIQDYATPYEIEIDRSKLVKQLFSINIGGYDYPFLVVKDSSKIKKIANIKTVDFKTFASIEFNSKYISADALISIIQNSTNSSILNKLCLDNGITYDIGLFSPALGKYMDKLDNGSFIVSVPISGSMLDKSLFAYYIKQDGGIERHRVTIKDGFATFETNHFSEYTIGEATGVELKIKKVANGSNELAYSDGKYILNSIQTGGIDIFYQLVNNDKDYAVVLKTDSGMEISQVYHDGMNYDRFYISIDRNQTNYKVQVCDTFPCQEVYDEININFDYQISDFINDARIVASNIKQANTLLNGVHHDANTSEKDAWGVYHSYTADTMAYAGNSMQTISLNVKAYNLVPEDEYMINYSSRYTGEQLMNGITYIYKPNFYSGKVELNLTKGYAFIADMVDDNNDLIEIYLHDDNLNDYDSELSYHNYKEQRINAISDGFVILSRNYLNISNPLDVTIKGDNVYLDQDYNVSVRVSDDGHEVYYKELSVNGLLLNGEYVITLDGLKLEYVKSLSVDEEQHEYTIDVSVDYVVHTFVAIYNSLGSLGGIYGKIYYRNGEQNLTATNGGGALRSSGENYYVNDNLFIKYPHIYLNYRSNNHDYDNTKTYSYELTYGEIVYDEYGLMSGTSNVETIMTGTVSGKKLNSAGLIFEVDNHSNYRHPSYTLYIKYGDEAIYLKDLSIAQTEKPMINSARLISKSRDLFLVRNNDTFVTSYIATRNAPNKVILSGLGLEANKEYELDVYYTFRDKRITDDDKVVDVYHEVVKLLGKDINNGVAIIENKYVTDKEYTDEYIGIMSDELFDVGINIEYVDCRDLIRTVDIYTLDNTKDIIKRIKKNTSVEEFISNFEIANNGKIKVYDSTGNTEIIDKVGTGMITRVIGEYDDSVLDVDMVVNGDINGDGNITPTDLVRLERYFAEIDELDGVYKEAGDVNGSDTLTMTDLIGVAMDVAEIKEIE